jgi:hypothetical protein
MDFDYTAGSANLGFNGHTPGIIDPAIAISFPPAFIAAAEYLWTELNKSPNGGLPKIVERTISDAKSLSFLDERKTFKSGFAAHGRRRAQRILSRMEI